MPEPLHAVVDDIFNRICRVNTRMEVDGWEGTKEGDRKRTRAPEEVAIQTEGTNTTAMALTHITNILTRNAEIERLKAKEMEFRARDALNGMFSGSSSDTVSGVVSDELTRLFISHQESMTALQHLVGYAADPPFDLAAAVKAKKNALLTKKVEEAHLVSEERERQAQQNRVDGLSRGGAQ